MEDEGITILGVEDEGITVLGRPGTPPAVGQSRIWNIESGISLYCISKLLLILDCIRFVDCGSFFRAPFDDVGLMLWLLCGT